MKAVAVFPDQKQYRVIDHPEPKIERPGEARLRILDVGICGTDKEIVSFQYGTPPAGSDYLIIGHESLGEVVEVGADVKNVRPGDLVVTSVRRPCDHSECVACRAGRHCPAYRGRDDSPRRFGRRNRDKLASQVPFGPGQTAHDRPFGQIEHFPRFLVRQAIPADQADDVALIEGQFRDVLLQLLEHNPIFGDDPTIAT